jgi:hypothetical protein
MKTMFRLLLLLFMITVYMAECRLNAPPPPLMMLSAQRQLSLDRTLKKKGKGTIVVVKEDVITEDQCEVIVTMVMPNFAVYTVGGPKDVESMGTYLVQRSISNNQGAFMGTNITDAKLVVQKVAPIENESTQLQQRQLSQTIRGYGTGTTTKRPWSWNSVKFQASINRCRWCNPDNSDRRLLSPQQQLEDDNWFAYKYLRSIQQSSDWLDDATYIRVQADCETLQLDGTYDENNVEQRIQYASMDDEDYSPYRNDEI